MPSFLQTRVVLVATTILVAAVVVQPRPAEAVMTLTGAASTMGFGLTTFASGLPNTGFCCGPLGITFPDGGGVLVADYNGTVYHFANADGQTPGSALHTNSDYGANDPVGLTNAGGQVYLAVQSGGGIDRLSDTGARQSNLTLLPGATGLATNPINGHIYAGGYPTAIYEIDPSGPTTTTLVSGAFDGLTVSTDGRHLYAAIGTQIRAFSTGVNGAPAVGLEATYEFNDSVDGAALGTGSLAGYLFANTNSGNLWQMDMNTNALTLLASGGSRGDFLAVDPTNGTLLITQTDSVLRLTAPSGAAFDGQVPEPATGSLMVAALAGLAALRRRFRRG